MFANNKLYSFFCGYNNNNNITIILLHNHENDINENNKYCYNQINTAEILFSQQI